MGLGAAVAEVRESVTLWARVFRQDQSESFLDDCPERATGLLRMSLCPGEQIVMMVDVKSRFHAMPMLRIGRIMVNTYT